MLDLFQELTDVTSALNEAGIDHALVGGLAYSILVQVRGTEDIDLLVHPEDWDRISEVLAPLGYRALAAPMDFENIKIRRLTKIADRDTLMIDLLLAEGEATEGLRQAAHFEHEGKTYRVASPQLIIALKRGRMSAQDRSDIEGLENLIREQGDTR